MTKFDLKLLKEFIGEKIGRKLVAEGLVPIYDLEVETDINYLNWTINYLMDSCQRAMS